VTALLEFYLQSDCSIRVFRSFNAGIDSCSISLFNNYFQPAAYQVLLRTCSLLFIMIIIIMTIGAIGIEIPE